MIRKILIVMAMQKEADYLIQYSQFKYVESRKPPHFAPAEVYEKRTSEGTVTLMVSGKDPQHNVDRLGHGIIIPTWQAIQSYEPHLIINLGTAGGLLNRGAAPGDIYVSSGPIMHHDRNFESDRVFRDYAMGSIPCCPAAELARHIGVKTGIVSTGASMDNVSEELIQIERSGAVVKEMEAAHVADMAKLACIPVIALKAITDNIDSQSHQNPQQQFLMNFDQVMQQLVQKTDQAIQFCLGKTLKELNTPILLPAESKEETYNLPVYGGQQFS